MPLPKDHLERVYAGVIGKVVGVYLGRPFEGWPREKILSDLGYVRYYVNHKCKSPLFKDGNTPLVVTDDDVTCTFTNVRALEEHGARADLMSEEIGKTWLNQTVEGKSMFWWGGRGISTEHTAYLNLKQGIPAPKSGSIEVNGKTVAEQIGGEIFIDGFAMCCPGDPDLAAKLAKEGASVSHDGESVYGAVSWAAMEAEAFLSADINRLIDTGLRYIPRDCVIAQSTADIRKWAKLDQSWEKTRDRIEEKYGMHIFGGACHVVPNHCILILSLLYGGHSFDEGIHIIVTCGWDTDSNGGNMGALLGIMHGLEGFETGPDWRGPLADRVINSAADGGYSINNCARIAYDLTNTGRRLAGQAPLSAPKDGAQYHFALPGSVQGFQTQGDHRRPSPIVVEQGHSSKGPALALHLGGLSVANDPVEVMTDTFMPKETLEASHYELKACPLIYAGQQLKAVVMADDIADVTVNVTLRIKAYGQDEKLVTLDGPSCSLKSGADEALEFTIPDTLDHQPICKVGVVISTPSPKRLKRTIWLDRLLWTGSPNTTFTGPKLQKTWPGKPSDPWRRAFIDNVSTFPFYFPYIVASQSVGEGGLFQGCRDWFDYRLTVPKLVSNNVGPCGPAVRYQGLRRWYAMLFQPGKKIALVKALDEQRIELVSRSFDWEVGQAMHVSIIAKGTKLQGFVDGKMVLEAEDEQYASGGIGLILTDGSASVDAFKVEPVEEADRMEKL